MYKVLQTQTGVKVQVLYLSFVQKHFEYFSFHFVVFKEHFNFYSSHLSLMFILKKAVKSLNIILFILLKIFKLKDTQFLVKTNGEGYSNKSEKKAK